MKKTNKDIVNKKIDKEKNGQRVQLKKQMKTWFRMKEKHRR